MSTAPGPALPVEYLKQMREAIETGSPEASFVIDSLLHADEMPPPSAVEAFWKKVEEKYRDSSWAKMRLVGTPKILANAQTMADILAWGRQEVPAGPQLNTEGPAHE